MRMFSLGVSEEANMFIRKDMIVAIGNYSLAENKRKCKEAKEKYMLSDYSLGKGKESVVFTSDGAIYISAVPTVELIKAFEEE